MLKMQWLDAVAISAAAKFGKRRRFGMNDGRYLSEELEQRVLFSGTFLAQPTQLVEADPQSAAVADLNGDGKADVVIANFGANDLTILLGDGNGTSSSQFDVPTGAGPNGVVIADVNGDHIPDLLVANRNDNNVSVLLGDVTGHFTAQPTVAVGTNPRSIAVGDFNQDGIIDFAVANEVSGSVSILIGNGDGTFQPQTTALAADGATSIAVGDFNGDGKLDLVTVGIHQHAAVLLDGDGLGGFHVLKEVPLLGGAAGVAVADMNGDGRDDLVVANYTTADSISVLFESGGESFGSMATYSTGMTTAPAFVTVADVNGDGIPDVVLSTAFPAVETLLGEGLGKLAAPIVDFVGTDPGDLAVADINGDGAPDLVVPNFGDESVSILLNDSYPTMSGITRNTTSSITATSVSWTVKFSQPVTGLTASNFAVELDTGMTTGTPVISPATGFAATYIVTVSDITGSGSIGLIYEDTGTVVNAGGAAVRNFLGFGGNDTINVAANDVALADMNGDLNVDAVSADEQDSEVFVALTTNDGEFTVIPAQAFTTVVATNSGNTGVAPEAIALADLNSDGKMDVVTADGDGYISVLLGNGDGTLQSPQNYSASPLGPSAITIADVNGDGIPDVVVTSDNPSMLGVFLGNGNGTFQAIGTLPAGNRADDVAVVDLNGDGKPELIVSDYGDGTISIFPGAAPQTPGQLPFGLMQSISAGGLPSEFQVADVNGDGKLDLVVDEPFDDAVATLLSDGHGSFGTPILSQNTYGVLDAKVGDFNGDGKPDVLGIEDGFLTYMLGNGDGTFQQDHITGQAASGALAVGDVDRDGIADAVVGNVGTLGVLNNSISDSFQGEYYTILKRDVTLDVTGAKLVFDGNPHPALVTATGTSGEDLSSLASLTYENTANNSSSSTPPTQIGTYKVFAAFFGSDSYNAIASFDTGKTVVISAHALATATLSVAGANVVFDGNAHPATITATGTSGEDLSSLASVTYENTANNTTSATQPSQIGTYEIFANFAGNNNYFPIDSFDTGKAIVISAIPLQYATVTVTGADALFDGNPHPATVTAVGTSGEDLSSLASLTYTNTSDNSNSSTPPIQAGTYEVFASFAGNSTYNSIASFDTGKSVVIFPVSTLQVVASGALPTAPLITGQTIKPIHLNVKITNNGAAAVTEAVTVNVALSSSASGTPQDPMVGTISKTVKLKAHQTAAFGAVLIKSLPAGLNGTEHLVFKLTDPSGAENLASAGTISVGPASNDLAAISVAAPPKGSLGKKLAATVAVMQDGNIPVNATLPAEMFLSTTSTIGAGAIDLGSGSGHISIQPGKKGNIHLSSTIPSSVTAGSYFLIVQLDPANTLADVNLTNNVASSLKMISVS